MAQPTNEDGASPQRLLQAALAALDLAGEDLAAGYVAMAIDVLHAPALIVVDRASGKAGHPRRATPSDMTND